ncbi:hypothetical protein IH980_03505, partial [Patescibacteria group bacterium]|nr:hypothetical protein [Patescibacteria group bacterium]
MTIGGEERRTGFDQTTFSGYVESLPHDIRVKSVKEFKKEELAGSPIGTVAYRVNLRQEGFFFHIAFIPEVESKISIQVPLRKFDSQSNLPGDDKISVLNNWWKDLAPDSPFEFGLRPDGVFIFS